VILFLIFICVICPITLYVSSCFNFYPPPFCLFFPFYYLSLETFILVFYRIWLFIAYTFLLLLFVRNLLSNWLFCYYVTFCILAKYSVHQDHRVGRVLSLFSSRWNWDSPNPSPARVCPPPPCYRGRCTLAGERGVGRGDIHCGTLYIYEHCDQDLPFVHSAPSVPISDN